MRYVYLSILLLLVPQAKAQISIDIKIRVISQEYLDVIKESEAEYYKLGETLTRLEHVVYRLSKDTSDSMGMSTYVDAKRLMEATSKSLSQYKARMEEIEMIISDYMHVVREVLDDTTPTEQKREFLENSRVALTQDQFTLKILVRERKWVETQIAYYDKVLLDIPG